MRKVNSPSMLIPLYTLGPIGMVADSPEFCPVCRDGMEAALKRKIKAKARVWDSSTGR
jgi:hypothetical protein